MDYSTRMRSMRWNQRKWDCDSCITTLYLVTRLQSVLPKRRLEYYSLVAPSNGLSSYSPFLYSSLMGHMKRLDIKFRILIIGRANSGKTSILEKVCDTSESPKIYRRARERGKRCQHYRFHHPFRLKSTPQQSYSAPQSHIVGLWLNVRILFVARQA